MSDSTEPECWRACLAGREIGPITKQYGDVHAGRWITDILISIDMGYMMKSWIITVGEPTPLDGENPRLYRSGMLANVLAERGNDVIWWTSAFDHANKKPRSTRNAVVIMNRNLKIHMLNSISYQKNISLARVVNHAVIAAKILSWFRQEQKPDIIIVSLPTIELAWVAVLWGKRYRIPVVVDVRDLWPDIFLELFPSGIRSVVYTLLRPYYEMARYACRNALAIIGLTDPFVAWGLEKGNRARKESDRVFPMGYSITRPKEDSLVDAEEFWKQHGLSLENEDFIVCFFGTMGRYFDLETVISAAKLISTLQYPIRFVMCGTGDNLNYYKILAGGCDNIFFPGWIDAAQIQVLMRLSSVGLAPYKNTPNFTLNLTNKPIEYLSSGLPVISSLKGILKDLIDGNECGVTFEEGNPEDLVKILVELYKTPEKVRDMSRNAKRLFEEQFVAEVVYDDLAKYLERLAENHKTKETK